MQNLQLKQFKDKKILILGLGLNQGGVGSAKFFSKCGAKVRVTDLKDKETLKPSLDLLKDYPDIEYILGEHRFEDLDWADLIIRNPALKPDNKYLKYAKQNGKQVEMDMGIFLQFVAPKQIIGVTGTKGKSTTASLIYEALKASGKEVVFAGNIGKSVLDTIPFVKENSLVVLELSSFQLSAFGEHKVSPKYAVITNIYPDHLNYHGTMENYIEAKRYITKFQDESDFLFLRKGDEITNKPEFLKGLKTKVTLYSTADLPSEFTPQLPGEHNLVNTSAALAVATSILGTEEIDKIVKVLEDFRGVEFRLQLIYDREGIKIYNDTAATTPIAAVQAVQSLPNSILITGGMNKNLDYGEYAKAINENAKAVYFIEGDATEEIKNYFKIKNLKLKIIQGTYNNFEDILSDIKEIAQPGDTILFSPGATSFNLFQNEFDRGRKFNIAVEKIFHSP